MQHGERLYISSCAVTLITMMMMMLIITTAGDPFSDHNVNNVIEDSLVVFGFSVLEASPFISDSPVRSADPLV